MQVADFPILLVTCDPDQAPALRRSFTEANLVNPLRACGNAEAKSYLLGEGSYQDRRIHPLPSFLFLDWDASDSGPDFLQWVRRQPRLRRMGVGILHSVLASKDRDLAQRLGVSVLLPKPVGPESLLELLRSMGMYWVLLRKTSEFRGRFANLLSEDAPRPPGVRDPEPRPDPSRQDTEILGDQVRFKNTSWDLVKSAKHSQIMDELIRIYWKPLYFFVRQKGFDNETSKDMVQDFLADALERGIISRADPTRGKFRTFLLTALSNFIRDWKKSSNRLKRGGGQVTLSLDFDMGERQYSLEIASGDTPETILNRAWLEGMLGKCIAELEGNPAHLQAFRLMIQGSSYPSIARQTGLSEAAVKAAVFRLRQQLREIVLRRIQGTREDNPSGQVPLGDLAALLQ